MDVVSEVENALGAELLRAELLRRDRPKLGGRYIVERVLGRGASGLVVAAIDERLNRAVALKIRPVEGDSAMLAEARALARLGHPNVVRIHDVETVTTTLDGRDFKLWLVSMEHIEGRTMRAWLREKPRSEGEVLGVFVDVGRGLAAAHAERIVHRDVKPDNVIVRADGVAQVLDFGFAVQAASTQSAVGGLRPAAGTDPYMSPEARLGRTSRKSDQFSLGVALVEALTGSPVPAGSRVPSGVSPAAWKVAQRSTSPDPEDRFADMKSMVDELLRVSRAPASSRTGPIALALLVAMLGAVGLGIFIVESWDPWSPGSASAREDLDASSAEPLDAEVQEVPDATAPVPEVTVVDHRGLDAGSDRTPDSEVAPLRDAGADAGRCPLPPGGQLTFRTARTYGGAPEGAEHGTYILGLDVRRRALRDVSVRRIAPEVDQLHVRAFGFVDGCVLHVVASADHRDYEFWLDIDRTAVTGRFEATHDARQPDFGGIVEAQTDR